MADRGAKREFTSKQQILRGSIWAIGLRWSLRLTGLVSTIVLARLLTPADFGLVTIASLIVGLVEVFSQIGPYAALTRHPNPTRDHYDSAWTVGILLGLGLSLITWTLIPFTTAYFNEPRAATLVAVLALRTSLLGAVNIGIVNFRRDLQFSKQFQYDLYPTLISFVATLAAAFVLRNYWALVIGILTQLASATVLSYMMDPFRPRICFSKVREIWSFSGWILLRNVGLFANNQFDKFAIGGFAGAAGMGRYNVAQEIAVSPTWELVMPMVNTLLPVMAKVQYDKNARRDLYLAVLYWAALICASTSIGVALVAEDMATLVLGPQWADVALLMPWFALACGVLGVSNTVYSALDTIGRPAVATRLQWLRVGVLSLSIVLVAYIEQSILAIAITRFIVTIALSPMLFVVLSRYLDIPARDFIVAIWRPLVAALMMAIVVLITNSEIVSAGMLRLILDIVLGATAYAISLMLLWHVGRPVGAEAELYENVLKVLRMVSFGQPTDAAAVSPTKKH